MELSWAAWLIIIILFILIIVGIIALIHLDREKRKCDNSSASCSQALATSNQTLDKYRLTPLPLSGALQNFNTLIGKKIFATYDGSGKTVLTAVSANSSKTVKLQNIVSTTTPAASQEWVVQSVTNGFTISTGDGKSFWHVANPAENQKISLSTTSTTFAVANNSVSSLQIAGNNDYVLTIDGDGDVALVESSDMFASTKLFTLMIFGTDL